jgi:hypothetical protein
MRRIGLWLIAGYFAFAIGIWVVGHIFPSAFAPDGLIIAVFYADSWLFLFTMVGIVVLNAGTAWGIVAFKRGRAPAPFTRREFGAAALVLVVAVIALVNTGSHAQAVVVHRDKPAPARPFKELYPQRTSAEPGDLERKLGEAATLDDATLTVTKTQIFEQRRGEFEIVDPGFYLIVFFDVTNRDTKPMYFSNMTDWSFDVPGTGRAEAVFPIAPMEAGEPHDAIAPGATVSARVALFLGADRASIAPGDYFAAWNPGPCAVSDANYLPKDYCRAVWPIGHF